MPDHLYNMKLAKNVYIQNKRAKSPDKFDSSINEKALTNKKGVGQVARNLDQHYSVIENTWQNR